MPSEPLRGGPGPSQGPELNRNENPRGTLRAAGGQRMSHRTNRREILKLMGVGGVVFASGLAGAAGSPGRKKPTTTGDFFFLQLSDTHWGYSGVSNPQADVTLQKAVDVINASDAVPDFIVFTGDLTHTTDDDAVRRQRMASFKQIVSRLKVKTLRFIPGEHDAAKDGGRAYGEH